MGELALAFIAGVLLAGCVLFPLLRKTQAKALDALESWRIAEEKRHTELGEHLETLRKFNADLYALGELVKTLKEARHG